MKLMKVAAAITVGLIAFNSRADVLKLDCSLSFKKEGKNKISYLASGYMVDYHTSHGPTKSRAIVVAIGLNTDSTLMSQSFADGAQRPVPGDALKADTLITSFVSLSEDGSEITAGEKRTCQNSNGKKCESSPSYGYTLNLKNFTFVPEEVLLYTYNCTENKERAELSHDEIEH